MHSQQAAIASLTKNDWCRLGTANEGKYSDSIADAFPYPSTSYLDDLAWGSVWLYKATMDDQYLSVSPNVIS